MSYKLKIKIYYNNKIIYQLKKIIINKKYNNYNNINYNINNKYKNYNK